MGLPRATTASASRTGCSLPAASLAGKPHQPGQQSDVRKEKREKQKRQPVVKMPITTQQYLQAIGNKPELTEKFFKKLGIETVDMTAFRILTLLYEKGGMKVSDLDMLGLCPNQHKPWFMKHQYIMVFFHGRSVGWQLTILGEERIKPLLMKVESLMNNLLTAH